MQKPLAGRVALVTGASSGIGAACAEALAASGAIVVLAARRLDRLEALAHEIRRGGGEASCLTVDVADPAQLGMMFDQVGQIHGKLDILVNNAGILSLSLVADADTAQWRRMVGVNLLALMEASHLALPLLRASGAGHIVNIASDAGRSANVPAAAYAASKFGVVGFSQALRREVHRYGIRVTVVEPGMVATELPNHVTDQSLRAALLRRLSEVEPMQPQDVAAAVHYAVTQPLHVNVEEILIRPLRQDG